MIPIPFWLLAVIIGVSTLGGAFGGWTVENWRATAEAADLRLEAQAEKDRLQGKIDTAAEKYEQLRREKEEAQRVQTASIRTIYKTLPPVAATCAPPPAAVGVLQAAVDSANAHAAGQPRPGLQRAPTAARPFSRP